MLKQKLDYFDFSNPPTDPIKLAYTLAEEMLKYDGIGLAANQLGLPYRVFAIKSSPILVCFNPIIVAVSPEKVKDKEGCLTFPGLFLTIERPRDIKVRWTQPNGETNTHTYTGLTARIFQHELDHLNGILFTEKCGPVALALAKAKLKKKDLL